MSKWKCTKCKGNDPCFLDFGEGTEGPHLCPKSLGNIANWELVSNPEQFGNSEQLPKLTADIFNHPDCPDKATFAIVYQDGSAAFMRGDCCDIKPTEMGCWEYSGASGVYQLCEIPGKFDASDWQNSLIERPPKTEKKELRHTPDFLPIRFKKLHPDAKAPYQATTGSAGWDLTATSVEPINGNWWLNKYGTGLAVEIPKGYVGLVFPRSSVYKTHTALTNCVGVIDSDYRGEISAVFTSGAMCNDYKVGDRICQIVIMPIPAVKFVEADELTETERGIGGYGSTGR